MIDHGSTTVATHGVAVPLKSTSQRAAFVSIWAKTTNAGQVRIGGPPHAGGSIPSGSGAPLLSGDAAVTWVMPGVANFDLNLIYVDADTDGDGVQWIFGAP